MGQRQGQVVQGYALLDTLQNMAPRKLHFTHDDIRIISFQLQKKKVDFLNTLTKTRDHSHYLESKLLQHWWVSSKGLLSKLHSFCNVSVITITACRCGVYRLLHING